MMKEEALKLDLISDLTDLENLKEKLKDKVVDSSLKWYERLDLYQMIQDINKRIDVLRKKGTIIVR